MLLTHPERIVRRDQLHVDCAGDESARRGGAADLFDAAAFFIDRGMLVFGRTSSHDPNAYSGSASAFEL
jgi:hypothetical protein